MFSMPFCELWCIFCASTVLPSPGRPNQSKKCKMNLQKIYDILNKLSPVTTGRTYWTKEISSLKELQIGSFRIGLSLLIIHDIFRYSLDSLSFPVSKRGHESRGGCKETKAGHLLWYIGDWLSNFQALFTAGHISITKSPGVQDCYWKADADGVIYEAHFKIIPVLRI